VWQARQRPGIRERDLLAGDRLRNLLGEQLVSAHIRVNCVTHDGDPPARVLGLDRSELRMEVHHRQVEFVAQSADDVGVLAELRQRAPLIPLVDGVRGAEDDLRPDGPDLLDDRAQVGLIHIGRVGRHIVHPEHDDDKVRLVCQHISVDAFEGAAGLAAAHAGIDDLDLCIRVDALQGHSEHLRPRAPPASVIVDAGYAVAEADDPDGTVSGGEGGIGPQGHGGCVSQ
jgi:hypothetical protein